MLSIIVPVYNAFHTIRRCVEALQNQSLDDFEIILVDDGSVDGSGALCDEMSSNNRNIKVYHIDNSGPFHARRTGARNAKGDVITFADADDWVDEGTYAKLLDDYYRRELDMLLFTYKYGDNGFEIVHNFPEGEYNDEQIKNLIIPYMIWDIKLGMRRLDPSLCCKFMNKQLYLGIVNDVDERIVLGEDAVVTYPMMCNARKIMICNKPYYNYCVSTESSTRCFPLQRIEEIKNFKTVLARKMKEVSDFNFVFQIDCYVRIFLNMISWSWFSCARTSEMYSFPHELFTPGEKISLYGAGDVGKSYYCTLMSSGTYYLSGWFDKNADTIISYNGEKIRKIDEISDACGDKILVAVRNKSVYEDIKVLLIERGIHKENIIWKEPVIIG